jgi:hypothetical protein
MSFPRIRQLLSEDSADDSVLGATASVITDIASTLRNIRSQWKSSAEEIARKHDGVIKRLQKEEKQKVAVMANSIMDAMIADPLQPLPVQRIARLVRTRNQVVALNTTLMYLHRAMGEITQQFLARANLSNYISDEEETALKSKAESDIAPSLDDSDKRFLQNNSQFLRRAFSIDDETVSVRIETAADLFNKRLQATAKSTPGREKEAVHILTHILMLFQKRLHDAAEQAKEIKPFEDVTPA